MIKITDKGASRPIPMQGRDIPFGQAFRGRIGSYPERLFICVAGPKGACMIHALDGATPFSYENVWGNTDNATINDYVPVNLELVIG